MYNELANACINLNSSTVVSVVPMIRKQPNGNFTGFSRTTYTDGNVIDAKFVENARSRDEVIQAWGA